MSPAKQEMKGSKEGQTTTVNHNVYSLQKVILLKTKPDDH